MDDYPRSGNGGDTRERRRVQSAGRRFRHNLLHVSGAPRSHGRIARDDRHRAASPVDHADGVFDEPEHQAGSCLVVEDVGETRQAIEGSNGNDG